MRIYISSMLLFFSFSVTASYGQTVAGLPVQFVQFYKTYFLINPASIGRNSRMEFNTGNRALTGGFSDIRTFYANANIRFGKSDSTLSKHAIGIIFINEKEGTYINRNTASFLYTFHIPLTSRATLSAGLAAGFINYTFKASNINNGGSDFAPSGDLGLWMHKPDFNLGISCNQFIPSTLTPFNATYRIDRHYNLVVDKSIHLNRNFLLKPTAIFRWFSKELYDIDLGLASMVQQNLIAVIAYKYKKGMSISGGFDNIKIGQNTVKLLFSYYDAIGPLNYYNPQSYELSLNFMPNKKKKIQE